MVTIKVVLIAIALVSTAIFALSVRVVLVKDGKIPDPHPNHYREQKQKSIQGINPTNQIQRTSEKPGKE